MAAAYTHGVLVTESPTSLVAPVQVDSAVQVAIGTAPVHMSEAEDPMAPQLAYTWDEAVRRIGYSTDYASYTLSQVIQASFAVYGVAPVVFINVLDPAKHNKNRSNTNYPVVNGKVVVDQQGMVPEELVVKSEDGSKTYTAGTDYTLSFDENGYTVVSILTGGSITSADTKLKVSGKQLDPTKVTDADILAGIAKVREVYPRFNIVPGTILAPGWSHKPAVYQAMTALTDGLNGIFRCTVLSDISTEEAASYDAVNGVKNKNSITGQRSLALWPMCKVGDTVFHTSALAGAHIAHCDGQNEGVPYVSPSNKEFKISGICDNRGKEIVLDQEQANLLNGQGVCTAINMNGWRFWGNRTAGYPGSTDVKDTFIPVRRMFNWWANTFILTYFQKVDDPMNKRLVESVVDSENIRANGFRARLQIADARMEYRVEDNPETDLLNGTIRFKQYFTPFPPAETIINDLEFDPHALSASLSK